MPVGTVIGALLILTFDLDFDSLSCHLLQVAQHFPRDFASYQQHSMLTLDSLISTQATIESNKLMFNKHKQLVIIKWSTQIERSSQQIPITFVQFLRGSKALWLGKSLAKEYPSGTKVWLRGKVTSCKGGAL